MAERLTHVPRVREVESLFPKDRPNLTQRCKRFTTALTYKHSSCVALALWRGDRHRKLVTRFSVIRRV